MITVVFSSSLSPMERSVTNITGGGGDWKTRNSVFRLSAIIKGRSWGQWQFTWAVPVSRVKQTLSSDDCLTHICRGWSEPLISVQCRMLISINVVQTWKGYFFVKKKKKKTTVCKLQFYLDFTVCNEKYVRFLNVFIKKGTIQIH